MSTPDPSPHAARRAALAALDDAALAARARAAAGRVLRWPDDAAWREEADAVHAECLRRKRRDLWDEGVKGALEERERTRRGNEESLRRLRAKVPPGGAVD